jgi:hypothetical protein
MHFLLWFHLNIFYRDLIYDGKIYMDWKNYDKNFNQQITMDFWMTKFGPYFLKVPILVIFCWIDIFSPITCMLKNYLDG